MRLLYFIFLMQMARADDVESAMERIFPNWKTFSRGDSNRQAVIFLCIFLLVILILYKVFVARERKVADPQKAAVIAQEKDGSLIVFNGDADAPLLAVGNEVALAPTSGTRLKSRVLRIGDYEITVMVLTDQLGELSIGRRIALKVKLGQNIYTVKTSLARVDSRNPRICSLVTPHPVTLNNLRHLSEISKPLPALFGVIPGQVLVKNSLPFADIYRKSQADMPATIVALDTDFATLRTACQFNFSPGDLLMLQFAMPTDCFPSAEATFAAADTDAASASDNELTIWCGVSAVYKAPPDIAIMIRVDFLTADPRIAHLCASIGRPFVTVKVSV